MTFEAQRLVESSSHSQTAGFPLFTGAVFQPQSLSFTGRPFIEGSSWGHTASTDTSSLSFTGRPFIEGRRGEREDRRAAESLSFTGRPFIEGPWEPDEESTRVGSLSFTGRPFIEGKAERAAARKSGSRCPLRDGLSLRERKPKAAASSSSAVAVLYGTAFH